MIQYLNELVELPPIAKLTLNQWIKAVAASYGKNTGEIAYVFCNDERILQVNRQYLNHDYYTDIITFDYSEGKKISGDIFISVDTVKSNAEEYKVTFEEELNRIIIHGILHLCGNDDNTPQLRLEMTNKENRALLLLKSML